MAELMKSPRVCVVSALYHPTLGGLGKQAQKLTERLSREGVSLFVIARRMSGMPPARFDPAVRVYRAWSVRPRLHTFEKVTFINILTSLTFSLSTVVLLFLNRKKYDVVHFHGASLPLIVNLPLLKALRKRIIAKVASSNLGIEPGSFRGRYFGLGMVLSAILKRVDKFIALTSEIEENLAKEGIPREIIVRIPNFVDFSEFSPCSDEIKREMRSRIGFGEAPLVTFTGRFIECKGIAYLLEAWKDVSLRHPEAKLLLLGDGPLMTDMRKLALSLNIEDSVIMKGHVRNVIDYLRASDVYVLPSFQEGMPNALLEALACGLPAVATRISGVVDMIEDRHNGILVEPGDARGLAEGITLLLNNREERTRIALAAFQRIASSYSIDTIVSRYLTLYKQIMSDQRLL